MRLIKSSVELIEQAPSLGGLFRHIERCGRTSYQSYDKMDDTSYERFCKMIEQRGHLSVFEHGTVYLLIPNKHAFDSLGYNWVETTYCYNPYSIVHLDDNNNYCITTNYRVIVENEQQDDLKFLCEPTKFHDKRISIKFICSISIGREILRHRQFSMIQESTRYCNYNKEKWNNSLTFIIPEWCKQLSEGYYDYWDGDWCYKKEFCDIPKEIAHKDGKDSVSYLLWNLVGAENSYKVLSNSGCSPQEAREVLPLATKTELIMTGTAGQWEHFLKLRSPARGAVGVHPDCAKLANEVLDKLVTFNYIQPMGISD